MIVVTGAPRTGTSMVMQTLKILGVPIAGRAQHPQHGPSTMNPKGYWTLTLEELLSGIADNRHEGRAVKVLGYWLKETSMGCVSKIVHCKRDVDAAYNSFLKLCLSCKDQNVDYEIIKKSFHLNRYYAEKYTREFQGPSIDVDYEMVTSGDTEKEIRRLAEFVGVDNQCMIEIAIKNVDRREICRIG